MDFHFDISGMDVSVGFNEMIRDDRRKELRRRDGMLLCHDIDSLLHGISGHDYAVIGLREAVSGISMPVFDIYNTRLTRSRSRLSIRHILSSRLHHGSLSCDLFEPCRHECCLFHTALLRLCP